MRNVRPLKMLLLHVVAGDVYWLKQDRAGRILMTDVDDFPEFITERASQFYGFSVFEGHQGEIEDDDMRPGGIAEDYRGACGIGDEWTWGAVRVGELADVADVFAFPRPEARPAVRVVSGPGGGLEVTILDAVLRQQLEQGGLGASVDLFR